MKSSELLSILKQCHSNEPEFIQAVEEFWKISQRFMTNPLFINTLIYLTA